VIDKTGNKSEITVTVNKGHTPLDDDGDCTTPVLCKFCGEQAIAAKEEHTWSEWASAGNGRHNRHCTTADCKAANAKNCSGGTATCTLQAVCEICGGQYGGIDSKNHRDLEHKDSNAATVTSRGNREYWYCKDCGKCFADKDGITEIKLDDIVISKLPPKIIEGQDASVSEGERKALVFRSNAAFCDFIRVEIDAKTLNEENYTKKEGSTIITLKADYIATLPIGEHTIDIVSKSCAYTNHTILAEALEKWPVDYLNRVVPQLMPIIKELDRRVRGKYTDKSVYIIDDNNLVHMAHIDIHYGMSVNGVAKLHTEILENTELNNFYRIYPEKFNNKTNGITFRRWLIHCNNGLAKYIETLIGSEYRHDAEKLKNLLKFAGDKNVYDNLLEIKTDNKRNLAEYLKQTQGIEINPQSIFDIQIKRLHEYKRQQMNALYIIYKYFDIKAGNIPKTPVTVIFGAKAAPAYTIAKDIIHLILTLSKVIEADKDVSPYLKVVLVQNYNVTLAEKLIPACDISEQISLASKEASGTGNMKFMLNGAVTLGTMDGANVEIAELVGKDNIYTFGATSDEVIAHYEKCDYNAKKLYETDALIKKCVDFIISDAMLQAGDSHSLNRLYNEIVGKDWFMALLDLRSYIETKEKALTDYDDRYAWAEKMLVNIANAGFFSSDRTIKQYNEDIWHL